jgi:hypothetical protein
VNGQDFRGLRHRFDFWSWGPITMKKFSAYRVDNLSGARDTRCDAGRWLS